MSGIYLYNIYIKIFNWYIYKNKIYKKGNYLVFNQPTNPKAKKFNLYKNKIYILTIFRTKTKQ